MIEVELSFEDLLRYIRKIAPQLDPAERRFLIDEIERAKPLSGGRAGAVTEAAMPEPARVAPPPPVPAAESPAKSSRQSLRERVAAEAEAARKSAARPESRPAAERPPPPASDRAQVREDVTPVTTAEDSEWFRQFAQLMEAPRNEASKVSAKELEALVRQALEEVVGGARPV